MKKISCILVAVAALTLWSSNAMADHDPFMCFVEINYNGKDFGGHDDGITEEEALHEAKEEACERACRKYDDACEHACMKTAVVKSRECKENPKANKNNPKGDYDCRVAIRYNDMEYHAFNDDHHLDKAARETIEEACEDACRGQDKPKKCEHKCRIHAEVIGTECFDQNDRLVLKEGQLPPRPATFHPNADPSATIIPPVPAPDKKAGKEDKKPGKEDMKPGKGDKKPGKDDMKPGKKKDKKPGKDDMKPGKEDKKADKGDKKPEKGDKKADKGDKKPEKGDKKADKKDDKKGKK